MDKIPHNACLILYMNVLKGRTAFCKIYTQKSSALKFFDNN